MGDEKAEAKPAGAKGVDAFFDWLAKSASKDTGSFAAFLFIVVTIGILAGYLVTIKAPEMIYYAMLAPLVLGLIAYYNRAASMILLFVLLAFLVLTA